MIAYRVTTHDLRPPMQGGEPVPHLPGELLPLVKVDRSRKTCAAGRSACRTPHDALRIARLWPGGRPSRLWRVESVEGHEPLERGDKLRAATWRVIAEEPITDAILADLHRPLAGAGLPVEDLVAEVQAWRLALSRPARDTVAVEAGLRAALDRRGLGAWTTRGFATLKDVWGDWDAWSIWDVQAAVHAQNALDIWIDGAIRTARGVWAAKDARTVVDAWGATGAQGALIAFVAAHHGGWRTPADADLLTVGLRDAYAHGLGDVAPTGATELGWTMDPEATP